MWRECDLNQGERGLLHLFKRLFQDFQERLECPGRLRFYEVRILENAVDYAVFGEGHGEAPVIRTFLQFFTQTG